MKLNFYGGAKSVTGANYLLDFGDTKIIVDCGLFQGSRYAEEMNYENFPYNPAEVDFIFITHSHADHIGRIPKLFKEGFRGKIYATRPTIDLARASLEDNVDLLKDEAKELGHDPIYSGKDLEEVLSLMEGVDYEQILNLSENIQARLHDAGHILGSSIIELEWKEDSEKKKIYFTGDLGNPINSLLQSPYLAKDADYVVIESAYGDRLHGNVVTRKDVLEDIIEEIVSDGGTIIIPSFAVERTQELLYEIHELLSNNRIPSIPVFLDSPLAIKLTDVYLKSRSFFNDNAIKDLEKWGGLFKFKNLRATITTDESKEINNTHGPKIIIAGSGMSMGGRIVHHELRYLPDPKSAIVFIGYQVKGSLGRRILDGEKEVMILGQKVHVNAKVYLIDGYSAHADQAMLLEWVRSASEAKKLKKVFVVQGEEEASEMLARRVIDTYAIDALAPNHKDVFEL